jgi:hypothetical protein
MLRTASSLPSYRAFDTGLRRRRFPSDTASLLPGLLAATRTGLTPASDDKLTNTKISYPRLIASPPVLLDALQILYKLFFRSVSNASIEHPSTPGAPLLAFTLSYASHTSRFEISNGFPDDFSSLTQLLPESPRLIERTQPRMT